MNTAKRTRLARLEEALEQRQKAEDKKETLNLTAEEAEAILEELHKPNPELRARLEQWDIEDLYKELENLIHQK